MTSSIRLSRSSSCIATPRKEKSGQSPLFQDFSTCRLAWQAIRVRSAGGEELADGGDDLVPRNAALLARPPGSNFDEAALGPRIAEGDTHGNAEQIRVLELHARALVAVIEQGVETLVAALAVERVAGLGLRLVADVDDHDVDDERRDGGRPHDAVGVRALLDGGGGDPRR